MHQHHPHPSTCTTSPASTTNPPNPKRGQKRGSYNCTRCGLPKKGHTCQLSSRTSSTPADSTSTSACASAATPLLATYSQFRQASSHRRRALSFDHIDIGDSADPEEETNNDIPDPELDFDAGGLPATCLWEVLKWLPPSGLLSAAQVCKGWRDTTIKLWKAAEELTLRIPRKAQAGIVGSVLQKCSGLVRLSLRMQSDMDGTMMACIAFSCPGLKALDITLSDVAVNRITGDQLGRFVEDKRSLLSLKMEGCSFVGAFSLSSLSLSILWLSGLHSLLKTVFNCPNLKEVSLNFSHQENDNTDVNAMINCLGRGCPRLTSIHISSVRLSHASVLALTAANLRGLRMLSLVLGPEITDASVAAISSSYLNLELLDLSGSSISDTGIGIICNVYPETLSRLLLSLCPNITSSGIQFATAQLPLLELMDCGMTICNPNSLSPASEEDTNMKSSKMSNKNLHLIYQKLIIKHGFLKKLSLWGCSGLDALYLNCPELNDLNLNSCTNLHPERLLLHCWNLDTVYAAGCQELLIGAIKSQISNNFDSAEYHFPVKRMSDGSKRVTAPRFVHDQACESEKQYSMPRRNCRLVVD